MRNYKVLLTHRNISHYPIPNDNYIVTPKELLVILQQMERFLQRDFEYEEIINKLIDTNLKSSKYTSGDELLEDIFENTPKKIIKESYFADIDL